MTKLEAGGMTWKIGDAKQHFSEVIRAAEQEPQWIYNRERLVAAVVEPETLQEFLAWREKDRRTSLADAFAGLRDLCAEEHYEIEIPSRQDRQNPFADDDELPR
jgi:antitoxin (DNA-binding transcriptional repressor) of toxin-antitoxin stability system